MPRNLTAGHIDGYCVGEPWNSESILNGQGWCPATSAELATGHPEKVLLVTGEGKSEALARVMAGPDRAYPASLLDRSKLLVMADNAALPA